MEKNYFLSMLPLVGGSFYSRGLLPLVGSRGCLQGNRAICRGTWGVSYLQDFTYLPISVTPVYQVFHYTSIYILRQLTLPYFHSGRSNTNSFRLLATLFITKNSIDMRILSTELSQLKRIAIINAISNCVCKGCLISVIS